MPTPLKTFASRAGTVHVFADSDRSASATMAADLIRGAVDSAGARCGKAVLGLATGSTPVPVYSELVTRFREGDLRLNGVTTYNLDEYYPISPRDPNSYRTFMHRHLFSQVEIAANRTHILDGTVPESFLAAYCEQYEAWIEADGGLDLQLLGIGRNGHIGFNEPSTMTPDEMIRVRTRCVPLHPITLQDAARDFGGDVDAVPRRALTMGVGTILGARSVLILAFGKAKADAVARALAGPISAECPASLLQTESDRVTWIVDESALGSL